jgi:hypothetical protein
VESWRTVFRDGFVPGLSDNALLALAKGLGEDDPRLMQGRTTDPPPLQCVQSWPCQGGCLIGYAGWIGEGLTTVGEVEEYFARCCFDADQRLGNPGACRWLLNWFDDTPREDMRRELLAEVDRAIKERGLSEGDAPHTVDLGGEG